jgi:hypothetical protein
MRRRRAPLFIVWVLSALVLGNAFQSDLDSTTAFSENAYTETSLDSALGAHHATVLANALIEYAALIALSTTSIALVCPLLRRRR